MSDSEDIWAVNDAPKVVLNIPAASSSTSSLDNENQDTGPEVQGPINHPLPTKPPPQANNHPPTTTTILPSPDEAFNKIKAPPTFLNPEALRQPQEQAANVENNTETEEQQHIPPFGKGKKGKKNKKGKKDWDISSMAPALKDDEDTSQQAGVTAGAAVRYTTTSTLREDDVQIHLPIPGEGKPKTGTKAMAMDDFIAKGGAALPRKRQASKDKEMNKRMKGQSTHSEWKSEAEMALRQQYD